MGRSPPPAHDRSGALVQLRDVLRGLAVPLGLTAVGALFIATFLKGLVTHAHEWPVTELELTYRFGLIKRGLVGTLLIPFVANKPAAAVREMVSELATIADVVMCILLFRASRWLATAPGPKNLRWLAMILLATSPVIWNLALSLGYLDVLLVILGLVLIAASERATLAAAAAALLAIAVHELASIFIAPLLLLVAIDPGERWGFNRGRAWRVGAALLVGAGLTLWLSRHGPSTGLEHHMLDAAITSDWWVHTLLDLQREPLSAPFGRIWSAADVWPTMARNAILYLPATLAIFAVGLLTLWRSNTTVRARALWTLAYLVASMGVLASNIVAFDYQRLFALANMQAFLAFFLMQRRLGTSQRATGSAALGIVAGICVLVAGSDALMKVKFTYLPTMDRWWPTALDAAMVDPLERIAQRVKKE